MYVEECVDMRKDLCFLNYDGGECSTPMTESQSKKVCCCSMGQAWGPCETCPRHGTSRYTCINYNKKLCNLFFKLKVNILNYVVVDQVKL